MKVKQLEGKVKNEKQERQQQTTTMSTNKT